MARPTIKASEVGAAAQTSDPSVKITTADKKIFLTEYRVYSFPNCSWKALMLLAKLTDPISVLAYHHNVNE
jgi:hypothetical protein